MPTAVYFSNTHLIINLDCLPDLERLKCLEQGSVWQLVKMEETFHPLDPFCGHLAAKPCHAAGQLPSLNAAAYLDTATQWCGAYVNQIAKCGAAQSAWEKSYEGFSKIFWCNHPSHFRQPYNARTRHSMKGQ